MLFCPNCNNVLDVSKTSFKTQKNNPLQDETPTTVTTESEVKSETENEDVIDQIINDLIDSKDVDEKVIQNYKMDDFVKHASYVKLDKKTKLSVQNKLSVYFGKIDDSISAYYVCKNCSYSKGIISGSLVMSKTGDENSFEMDYMNYDKLKNKVYNKALPITKNYICINEKCESHKNIDKREAVFYRIGTSLQVWYTCKTCLNFWKGE